MNVFIDVAGASLGGSARFLAELDRYLEDRAPAERPRVMGRRARLTPRWMLSREVDARNADLRIALNNVSFLSPGSPRVTLLRNALHFAAPAELAALGHRPPELLAQIPVVRFAARRSERVVVPCTAMAERVARHLPTVAPRLVVRHHPVSSPSWAGRASENPRSILVPIVPSPYKHLASHLNALLDATTGADEVSVVVTATADQLPGLRLSERLRLIGTQSVRDLADHWRSSQAVYFPTGFESFGYPLAEARASGRHVVAQDTAQNREIAGHTLCGFTLNDRDSLREAVERALGGSPEPDRETLDPGRYFAWLLRGAP